ncbi:unnamed protein product [Clonostachys chloroleuca]|uniref:Integral membrane bound transporter domain-containing protein n=1 Tax=Clonostachys chloroleuca TaxID=1926264 RepID=A0AA35LZG7_9HYPO|nr:unnamed protein product [Clonostachys chloroleuca]
MAGTAMERFRAKVSDTTLRLLYWFNSPQGRGVLKCTMAYTIASLATFVTPVAHLLGKPGGKHVVATITVYFHPARTTGSMIEAVIIAIVAIAYAEVICLLSMATSVLFGAVWGMVTLAHVLVVVLFFGGAFGFMGWVKQKMENPLVNVASTLASLAIISVLTKETAVIDNVFSNQKIVQVLKILLMGIASTTMVNLFIWRVSARTLLRNTMDKGSTSLGDMLAMITRGFMTGTEDDPALAEYSASSSAYRTNYPQMMKNLREAKFEHYLLGHETIYVAERALVKSMEKLAQSIGALRSASSTLFVLLDNPYIYGQLNPIINQINPNYLSPNGAPSRPPPSPMSPVSTIPIYFNNESSSDDDGDDTGPVFNPPDFFTLFITSLKEPMIALTDEICHILRESKFEHGNEQSRASGRLSESIAVFSIARTNALEQLYEHPALRARDSAAHQVELEQVAAACGHFTSSMQAFAEDVQVHLETLEDLRYVGDHSRLSWEWMLWWRKGSLSSLRLSSLEEEGLIKPIRKHATPRGISDSMVRRRDTFSWEAAPSASKLLSIVSQSTLRFVRKLARDDILFGLKVGIGASLWGMLAFLERTREYYHHYRGEWGLLSFMIVCSMTVGASNTTGASRFVGTITGALLALAAWNISQGNPVILVFLGWLVSFRNFYLIVAAGKAPLGRMTQLAYNVSTLYAYSLSAGLDNVEEGDDEGGIDPDMLEIVKHRCLSVTCGILWGLFICRVMWPISARKKFKEGLSMLCLQMGLIWRRGPLAILLDSEATRSYLRSGEQEAMTRYAARLESLRQSASHEFELRGPFPFEAYGRIMRSMHRVLDGFYAMALVTHRSGHLTPGEKALLAYTAPERAVLCDRMCHIFQVIASSSMLEYPLSNAVPNIIALRNNLLTKVFQFRKKHSAEMAGVGAGGSSSRPGSIRGIEVKSQRSRHSDDASAASLVTVEERDYALLYAYVLVTGRVADELRVMEREVEGLYGVLDEDTVLLQ